jgi:hypothetical protein
MPLQVCCGIWGCCDADVCYNNATTGNQPFCGAGPRCTVSGGTTPAEGAGPMALCPVNTDCVNITLPSPVRSARQHELAVDTSSSKYGLRHQHAPCGKHAVASLIQICGVYPEMLCCMCQLLPAEQHGRQTHTN